MTIGFAPWQPTLASPSLPWGRFLPARKSMTRTRRTTSPILELERNDRYSRALMRLLDAELLLIRNFDVYTSGLLQWTSAERLLELLARHAQTLDGVRSLLNRRGLSRASLEPMLNKCQMIEQCLKGVRSCVDSDDVAPTSADLSWQRVFASFQRRSWRVLATRDHDRLCRDKLLRSYELLGDQFKTAILHAPRTDATLLRSFWTSYESWWDAEGYDLSTQA